MTTNFLAIELAHLVTAVPGIRATELGIDNTLRTIGSHIHQQDPQQARFGVTVEEDSSQAVIEIGIGGSRPVKDIVRDVQKTAIRSLSQAGEPSDASKARKGSGASNVREQSAPQVTIQARSLLQTPSPQQTSLVQIPARDDIGAPVR